jgi:hypothetical protein
LPALPLLQQVSGHTSFKDDVNCFPSPRISVSYLSHALYSVPEFRPSFRENKPKILVFRNWKRAFWACFREHWVYKFGQRSVNFREPQIEGSPKISASTKLPLMGYSCFFCITAPYSMSSIFLTDITLNSMDDMMNCP